MKPEPYLAGVRVLDFSMLTPGPFASQILADLGATVLKVERPGVGDLERITVPAYFHAYNRGKASVVLDLRSIDGIAAARELARGADVVIEGFRPGVMERLGLGFDAVREVQPNIVYVSLNGLGSSGPHAQDRGHDSEYMARIGALAVTPRPGGLPMYDLPMPISDYAAGMYAVIAILGELGRGDRQAAHVEVPVMAAGLAWMFPKIVRELQERPAAGEARELPGVGCFRTGDGRFVTITAVENHVFADLCRALDRPDLAEAKELADFDGRKRATAEINRAIADLVGRLAFGECQAHMERFGVPCAPVNSPAEALMDPQVESLGLIHSQPVLHADLPMMGIPKVRHVRPPALDEHGAAVRACGWAGLSVDREEQ